ncbi:MAG: PIG-L deacetylase family protein, partial [Pirellulales bacterium]
MLTFGFQSIQRALCLGAHADDIEIGCGGTLLRLLQERPDVTVDWIVFSAAGARRGEAQASAELYLQGCRQSNIVIHDFRDSFFPTDWTAIKECMAALSANSQPDVVFTHRRDDAHQDHRVLAELAWCA